ncbi:hypothetical protein [Nocardia brasiliensis]|uniref:hypothetical protein n=1 Tax=Nocardia brasiliensis TaxID=37326 RepID=UPI001892E0E6|nr:hypothetical protein [Nocardia brasiliensis]MBF6130164.1 hypothetical protein [Nocardia brasiliensis]
MTNTAIPVLVGQMTTGRTAGVSWALWPAEVYSGGCLLRFRLAPEDVGADYPDSDSLFATIRRLEGHDGETILVESGRGEVQLSSGRLPTRGGEPTTSEPWEYVWTLEYWWPREQWDDKLTLTWRTQDLQLALPIDVGALRAAADSGYWS